MTRSDEDWRLQGQEAYLHGATLQKRRYRAWSETWEHDHCEFCQSRFMDPEFSASAAAFVRAHPDVLTVGFAVQGRGPAGRIVDDYWWVCAACLDDFTERFAWTVIDRDPPPDPGRPRQP
jgi:hypothetical protein